MTEDYGIYKATNGKERIKDAMDYLSSLREGINRVQIYLDKRARYLPPADRVKLAENVLSMDELYWRQFQNFIDRVKKFRDV